MSLLPANMNQLEADMMSKCLEFSQTLVNQRQAFNLSFTIGIHSFSLDTRGSTTKVEDRKKLTPSQMRRNLKRREDFLKRKSEAKSSEQTTEKESENEVNSEKQHKCSICDRTFTTKNGLSIHKGKAHETENLRTSSSKEPSLKASPPKEAPREEQCVCCGDLMSPQHQCETPHQPEAYQPEFNFQYQHQPEASNLQFSFGGPEKAAPQPPQFSFGGPEKAPQPPKCNCFPPFCTHKKTHHGAL